MSNYDNLYRRINNMVLDRHDETWGSLIGYYSRNLTITMCAPGI